jgi:hypothetical protein
MAGFRYQEFGPEFRAEFFNATEWVNLVAESGRSRVQEKTTETLILYICSNNKNL